MMKRLLLMLLMTVVAAVTAQAQSTPEPRRTVEAEETIDSDLSSRRVEIESNFTGQEIVVFGTIEKSLQTRFEPSLYDVVIAVRGPNKTMVSRRKSRVAGIWINTDSLTLGNAPGYYALMTARPIEDIADAQLLKSYALGFDAIPFRPLSKNVPALATGSLSGFTDAVVRIMQRDGLYIYDPKGVSFVGRNLFRATVKLPANVPVGSYSTDVYLFRDGEVLSHNRSKLNITKVGFERFVYSAAFDYPLLYGIIAVIIAIASGLLASALARRD